MTEKKSTPGSQVTTEKGHSEKNKVVAKTGKTSGAAAAHKSNGSELLSMFSSSDHANGKQQKNEQSTGKKGTKTLKDAKDAGHTVAGVVPAAAQKLQTQVLKKSIKDVQKGKDEEVQKMTTTTGALLTAPQVDSAMPLPSDYVQFFVNPKEQQQVPGETNTALVAPVKHLLEQETTPEKTTLIEKEQEMVTPKADVVQTVASDGVKQRIIKCRNGVPESLIKAIKEYMDKQK